MPTRFGLLLVIFALNLFGSSVGFTINAWGQRPQGPVTAAPGQRSDETESQARRPAAAEPTLPADAVTSHTFSIDGQKLNYTARAGTLSLTDAKGSKTGEIFYVAFTRDNANSATRPITIALNGGPGAASAYLDMVAIGPRILDFGDGRSLPPAHAKAIDNPDSWLDFTDLVFIDPIETGYSVATTSEQEARQNFFGVRADLDSLGVAIRLLLAKLDRYASPIYLVGESYGGFRAARLPLSLSQDQGLGVSGIILISPVLEFSLMRGDDFNPIPWALKLPSYAAVNLEVKGDLTAESLKGAERFALGDYLAALLVPVDDSKQATPIYSKIANLIGISESDVRRWHGRIPTEIFIKDIHQDEGTVASRYDGSVAGPNPNPSINFDRQDPILAGLTAPLTTGFVLYLRDALQFRTDRRYVLLNGDLSRRWDWGGRNPNSAPSATPDLVRALALNPKLKVMVVVGMTDLVAPYFMNRYVIDHLAPTAPHGGITFKLYPGGHMMYLRPPSRASLHRDARLFETASP